MTDFSFFEDGNVAELVSLSEIEQVAKEARYPNLTYTGKTNSFGRIIAKLDFSAKLLEELGWGDLDIIEVFFAPKRKHFFVRQSQGYGSTLKINHKSKKASVTIEHPNPKFFPEMEKTTIIASNYAVEDGKLAFRLSADEPAEVE